MLLSFLRCFGLSPSASTGFPSESSGFAYLASCLFPFVLPCFAPAAVPQVLTFRSRSGVLHSVRSLSIPFALGSDYSASALLFLSLPCFASQLAFQVLRRFFRCAGLSSFRPPGFPCFLPDSKYSAFCLFPFTLPRFAPTAVPQVLAFALTPAFSFVSSFFRPLPL